MKIIDLLNKIANGEEVPKYIKYYDKFHSKEDIMLCCYASLIYKLDNNIVDLTDEVEIPDDEEKGLPEKLVIEQDSPTSNYYIRNEYGTKCGLTKHSKIIVDKLNDLIDYLKKQKRG